ncbi:MAG: DUF1499 domain-containing protein [Chlamydiota bacterium]
MKFIFISIITLIAFAIVVLWVSNKRVPSNLGVKNGMFSPCPNKPNCVSSQSRNSQQYVDPFDVKDVENPIKRIKSIVLEIPKTKIVSEENDYLHVTFSSKTFSFIDDAEFYYDRDNELVQVRSAARAGYSDLGVNRKRIEWIRAQLLNKQ